MRPTTIAADASHTSLLTSSRTSASKLWFHCAPALVIMLGLAAVPLAAQGQTFSVLYSFTGGADGGNPAGALIRDSEDNLYGTAPGGGDFNCSPVGCGVVFKLDVTGKETVLHSFSGEAAGSSPQDGVIRDAAGNLYGTTGFGGDRTCACGVVFKLDASGKETVLHSFTGGSDGKTASGGLIRDANGNLYGTTRFGGDPGGGTVFKVDASGKETVLYSFDGGADGEDPVAPVVRDPGGNLLGTTLGGGPSGLGTIFKLNRAGKETVLHSFTISPDGNQPGGGLIPIGEDLYGTTEGGGDLCCDGTLYKLDKSGKETVLFSFTGGGDALNPFAGLIHDAAGNFYGITTSGGVFNLGTVFKLDSAGKETILHSFTGGSDGATPLGSLVRDAAGNLYGTAERGGAFNFGTVFKIAP
jgi:uncharacterized repeat protein (TIGR03803 family)